jgi:DNA-directed RNA polymerase specialized sigma24 family protein
MVGDLPTAEDIVQDVYARLHTRWSQIAAQDAVLPYVRSAVLNGCRSVLRRRAVARRVGAAHRDEPPAKSAENEVILSEDRRQDRPRSTAPAADHAALPAQRLDAHHRLVTPKDPITDGQRSLTLWA